MGIKGIYNEIGPGQRIALSKLAIETFEQKGRPLRIAIDVSIWLFQIQSGKGGTNPALRTFFYRLLRLISLSIHPLFVFDGPNKPPFKRNKRTGPNVASIPEFLAKQLLKQFGLPFHLAPGEAEAECALLQRKGIVDAVLSEDVDTLMFGSGMTLRNWSCMDSGKSNKTPTHVNVYHAQKTKQTSGLDREGMILVAVMSGGDYIPEGIPGCGPKTACEAAKAGFGTELCALTRNDRPSTNAFLTRLKHELSTNESKHFSRKHKALVIPDDFPRFDILKYYTHPVVSTDDKIELLRTTISWECEFDIPALRTFTIEAFNWVCVSGAKHFVRNLAPPILIKALRLNEAQSTCEHEDRLIKHIYAKRNHPVNDDAPEIRVGYIPLELVPIDLDAEDPDPEEVLCDIDSDEEALTAMDEDGVPLSPRKKRGPTKFDPSTMERIWLMETLIRVGAPQKLQAYGNSYAAVRASAKSAVQASKQARQRKKPNSPSKSKPIMPVGALDAYTRTTKPGLQRKTMPPKEPDRQLSKAPSQQVAVLNLTEDEAIPQARSEEQLPALSLKPKNRFRAPPSFPMSPTKATKHTIIDLLSSPETRPGPRKRPLRRSQTECHAQASQVVPTSAPAILDDNHLQQRDSSDLRAPSTLRKTNSATVFEEDLRSQAGTSGTKQHDQQVELLLPMGPAAGKAQSIDSPRTPSKRTGMREVITISPQTPASHQMSIREFLSPRSGNIEQQTPSCKKVREEQLWRGEAGKPETMDLTANAESSEVGSLSLFTLPQATQLRRCSPPRNSAVMLEEILSLRKYAPPPPAASETLRLRTSLAGGFALEEQQQNASTSRHNRTRTTAARAWRLSKVDTVDLTDK